MVMIRVMVRVRVRVRVKVRVRVRVTHPLFAGPSIFAVLFARTNTVVALAFGG